MNDIRFMCVIVAIFQATRTYHFGYSEKSFSRKETCICKIRFILFFNYYDILSRDVFECVNNHMIKIHHHGSILVYLDI